MIPGRVGSVLCLMLICASGTPTSLPAQASAQAGSWAGALERFAAWTGRWDGGGWSVDRTGRRIEFTLVETVTPKAGGTVLLIEGHGARRDDRRVVTHNGVVLLYYDEHAGSYRWNGHEASSGLVEAEATPIADGVVWSIAAGPSGGTVRFTIHVTQDQWHEIGEASGDGSSWMKFMEIDLRRTP